MKTFVNGSQEPQTLRSQGTVSERSSSRKTKVSNPLWDTLTKVRSHARPNPWKVQFSTDEIVRRVLDAEYLEKEFLHDFSKQVERPLDSNKFVAECRSLCCDEFQMAQQVVLAGKTKLNKALECGLETAFGGKIATMKDARLYSKSQLGFDEPKALPAGRNFNPEDQLGVFPKFELEKVKC